MSRYHARDPPCWNKFARGEQLEEEENCCDQILRSFDIMFIKWEDYPVHICFGA